MDFHLVCIVLIFFILFLLEKFENYENNENNGSSENFLVNTSPLLDLRYNDIPYSINLSNKSRNFGNSGAFGSYPANPLCNSCNLEKDIVSDPYLHSNDLGDENGDLNGKVNTQCGSGTIGKNYNDLNKPFLVAGRSAGRTRQCRRIL